MPTETKIYDDPEHVYSNALADRLRYLAAQLKFTSHAPTADDIALIEEAAEALEGDTA